MDHHAGKSNRVVAHRNGEFVDLDINEGLPMKKEISPYMVSLTESLV